MLNFLRKRTQRREGDTSTTQAHEPPPGELIVGDLPPFPFASHLSYPNGFPMLDWTAANAWAADITDPDLEKEFWAQCDRAWLLHMRDALGTGFHLSESEGAAVVSTLTPKPVRAALDYMELTVERILEALEGPASPPLASKAVLIVFDDLDTYYRYAACYDPEEGEFAFSSGMYINVGCTHFITVKNDMTTIEPVIAHEMTHSCLAHLPMPLWLDEGIAVTMETKLTGRAATEAMTRSMWEEHMQFWGKPEIQEFWSGHSFSRPDEANRLSYELASFIVAQISRDDEGFLAFVEGADTADAGTAAAQEHLGIDLGEFICALLEQESPHEWRPDPGQWR